MRFMQSILDAINLFFYFLTYKFIGRRIKFSGMPSGRKILILSPHIDDEILGAGGTLYKHKLRGDELVCVYLTDGRAGYHPTLKGLDYVNARKKEAQEIAKSIGYQQIYFLDYPTTLISPLKKDEKLCRELSGIIELHKPDLVYLPFFLDSHPDHAAVTPVLFGAVDYLKNNPSFRVCSFGVFTPLTPWIANTYVDISDVFEKKLKILELLDSQVLDFTPVLDFNKFNSFLLKNSSRVELLLNLSLEKYKEMFGSAGRLKVVPVFSKFRYLHSLFNNRIVHKKIMANIK